MSTAEPTAALIEECRAALAEELAAWDIDPPLHHVKQAHDHCVTWLAACRQSTTPAQAPAQAAEPVGEVVLFGGDRGLKEVSWKNGKMPAPGTKLYAAPHPSEQDLESDPRCAECDIPNGCPEYCRCSPSEPAATGRVGLTPEEIRAGMQEHAATWFSVRAAFEAGVRFAEMHHGIPAPTGSAAPTGEA